MKLTRITKLRYRVFRDFVWPSGLHTFAQFNKPVEKDRFDGLEKLVERSADDWRADA